MKLVNEELLAGVKRLFLNSQHAIDMDTNIKFQLLAKYMHSGILVKRLYEQILNGFAAWQRRKI